MDKTDKFSNQDNFLPTITLKPSDSPQSENHRARSSSFLDSNPPPLLRPLIYAFGDAWESNRNVDNSTLFCQFSSGVWLQPRRRLFPVNCGHDHSMHYCSCCDRVKGTATREGTRLLSREHHGSRVHVGTRLVWIIYTDNDTACICVTERLWEVCRSRKRKPIAPVEFKQQAKWTLHGRDRTRLEKSR